jgi:hypothetical protein
MNILDENIIASQRQRLRSWRIRVRQVGVDIARKGLQDVELGEPVLIAWDCTHRGSIKLRKHRTSSLWMRSNYRIRYWIKLNRD